MGIIGGLVLLGIMITLIADQDSHFLNRRQEKLLLLLAFLIFVVFTMAGWFPAMDS